MKAKEKCKAKRNEIEPLHSHMDREAEDGRNRVLRATQQKDTHRLWNLITAAEAAFVKYPELEGPTAARMRGRWKVIIEAKGAQTERRPCSP